MKMLIYQVEIKISENIADRFEDYMLKQHIPDVMATGLFQRYVFSRRGSQTYQVQYFTDHRSLSLYLEKEASRLRADFIRNFPDNVIIERQTLEILGMS
ncbi:MAG: DUF4286 family protein [Acidobacteria bacterium]|nr:MAG: DUF4286 family protein [Acidobacteriota bacterium]